MWCRPIASSGRNSRTALRRRSRRRAGERAARSSRSRAFSSAKARPARPTTSASTASTSGSSVFTGWRRRRPSRTAGQLSVRRWPRNSAFTPGTGWCSVSAARRTSPASPSTAGATRPRRPPGSPAVASPGRTGSASSPCGRARARPSRSSCRSCSCSAPFSSRVARIRSSSPARRRKTNCPCCGGCFGSTSHRRMSESVSGRSRRDRASPSKALASWWTMPSRGRRSTRPAGPVGPPLACSPTSPTRSVLEGATSPTA